MCARCVRAWRLMVLQPCDGAQTAEACATSLDEMMEGKTRSSKDGHSSELLEGTQFEVFFFKKNIEHSH